MAVIGVGVDVVDITRFTESLHRTPSLSERLFTPAERKLPPPRLAGCFAAKEALAKALGAPKGLAWQDAEILRGKDGAAQPPGPGTVAAAAKKLGVRAWHLSLSHDGGMAVAMVVADG